MAKQKVCVVLGGNGFIGSHLVDAFAKQDEKLKIIAFDRYKGDPQFHVTPQTTAVDGDVFDYELFDKTVKGADYVVHCLSATNPALSDEDPYQDIDALKKNVEIFEHCVKAGVKKIAFISSGGAVYGKQAESEKVSEQHAPLPVSPYGISKLATEHYLEYFRRKHGVDFVICRLTNPFGPRQVFKKAQGVIPAFISQVFNNEPITIFGDGNNSRDYVYIEDAARMIARTVTSNNKSTVYNIGSGVQTSLKEILDACQQLFKKELDVIYKPAPKTFLQKTDVSIDRYSSEFGQPEVTSFIDGLAKTVGSHKQVVQAEQSM